jgi:hypothetical protein
MQPEDKRALPGFRPWRLGVLAALLTFAVTPTPALAQPGAPSSAPPVAKRKCVRYGVAQTPSGPVARCVTHRTEVLGRDPADGESQATAGSTPSPSGGSVRQGQSRNDEASRAVPPTPERGRDVRPDASVAAGHRSDGGGPGAAVLVIAGLVIAAAVLLGLMRRPLHRWAGDLRA